MCLAVNRYVILFIYIYILNIYIYILNDSMTNMTILHHNYSHYSSAFLPSLHLQLMDTSQQASHLGGKRKTHHLSNRQGWSVEEKITLERL